MKRIGIFLQLSLVVLCSHLNAQLAPDRFTRLTIKDGLPSQNIYDLAQDSLGFLYLGTDVGLVRFDGYKFLQLDQQDGLPYHDVINLSFAAGRLWLNTLGDVAYLEQDTILPLPKGPYGPFNDIADCKVAAAHGNIWISDENQLQRYDYELNPQPAAEALQQLPGRAWVFEHQDSSWLLNQDRRSCTLFNLDSGPPYRNMELPCLRQAQIIRFFCNASHGPWLYIHLDAQILALNTQTGAYRPLFELDQLASQLFLHQGKMWIVQPNSGIGIYNIKAGGGLQFERRLFEGMTPSSVLQDQEGNLWVGTRSNGLYFYPSYIDKVTFISQRSPLPNLNLSTVTVTPEAIALGSNASQVRFLNRQYGLLQQIKACSGTSLATLNRITFVEPLEDWGWLAGSDHGLYLVYDGEAQLISSSKAIKDGAVGAGGQVLISTQADVLRTSIPRLKAATQRPIVPAELFDTVWEGRAYGTAVDAWGYHWFYSHRKGLVQVRQQDTVFWAERSPLFNTLVKEIALLADSTLCLSTRGAGLIFIKNGQYRQVQQQQYPPSNFCGRLASRGQEVWVVNSLGLTHVAGFEFERDPLPLFNYRHTDVLPVQDIADVAIGDSLLYLATSEGLVSFNPDNIKADRHPLRLMIEEVQVNGKSRQPQQELQLEQHENNLRIRFLALSFRSQSNITYRYRLRGVEREWKTTKRTELTYPQLPHGDYSLELSAHTDYGATARLQQPLEFSISPHFTKTPIFLLSLAGIVIVFLLLIYRYYEHRRQNRVLNWVVSEKTSALKEKVKALALSNEKLRQYNTELEQFAHIVSHDLKSPLRNINSFTQLLNQRAREKLSTEEKEYMAFILDSTQRMDELVNDLLQFSQIEKQAAQKRLLSMQEIYEEVLQALEEEGITQKAEVELETALPKLRLHRNHAFLLLYNLLSNALKFRASDRLPRVKVGCREKRGCYVFYVQDNGIGIEAAYAEKIFKIFQRLHAPGEYAGTGIGLAICQKIVEANQGRIWFESAYSRGSTFYFQLPKNKSGATGSPAAPSEKSL